MEMPEDGSVGVNFTAMRGSTASFVRGLKETFLPDDPFTKFKSGKGSGVEWCKVVKYFVPILEWLPDYDMKKLRYDLLAGVTIASLSIPQGISYARLANLPPIIGLYSSFVPPLVYAAFGSSMNLAVGTVASCSMLLGTLISRHVSPEQEPHLFLSLFFTSAFFTGIIQLSLGVFRLGILIDVLSKSTILGFMGGTTIIIILQQLKGMLGLKHFTTKTDAISVLHSVFQQRHEWSWQSGVFGIVLLCILLGTRQLKIKFPRLFWVSAVSPLLVVIFGGLFAALTHADKHGIPTVGQLSKGINPISIGQLNFGKKHLKVAMEAGFITSILSLAEGIAVGRSLAMKKNQQIDGNKEMIAFGLMNVIGSFFSCYLTTGPFSKSVVNYDAGCKTPASNIVLSLCMLMVLLFLAPLFKHTPLVALSAIIISSMIGLIEYKEAYHLFKVDKFDFCICMAAFFGVIFISMDVGLMISVGISILRALLHIARPSPLKVEKLQNSTIYRDIEQYPRFSKTPGILILQLSSPIYFANANYLRERILRFVEEEISKDNRNNENVLRFFILDMGAISSIDNAGIDMLREVYLILRNKEITLVLTDPRIEVMEKLMMTKTVEMIEKKWFFLSINDAVDACQFALEEPEK